MRIDRLAVAAVAGAAASLLAGGGSALADDGDGNRAKRCGERLERIAERRDVSVAELRAAVEARLLARVDAALKAGRISPERAAALRARIAEGDFCRVRHHRRAHIAVHGMMRAAAEFLGLERAELRAELRGTSLAGLAAKQGKTVDALEAAMVAPAKARLARAVASGRISRARADALLEGLEKLAERLANRVFPAR
jgi:hypothetical protein